MTRQLFHDRLLRLIKAAHRDQICPAPDLQRAPPLNRQGFLSQEEAAIELGCTHQNVALIEKEALRKLCVGLSLRFGVKLDNLTLEDIADLLSRDE